MGGVGCSGTFARFFSEEEQKVQVLKNRYILDFMVGV